MKKAARIMMMAFVVFSVTSCMLTAGEKSLKEKQRMDDIFDISGGPQIWSADSEYFIQVFEKEGIRWRAVAKMGKKTYDSLKKIGYGEDRQDKLEALIGPLEVVSLENLSVLEPSQKELDSYKDGPGRNLLNNGFEISGYSFSEDSTFFYMDKGLFGYSVEVYETGVGDCSDYTFRRLTVKDIHVDGVNSKAFDHPAT